MGVCFYPSTEEGGPETLLRLADHALYESKAHKNNRSRYWVVHGETVPQHRNLHQILLDEGAVEVYYQPIIDGRSLRIVGVEALARLRGVDGCMIYPKEFLPRISNQHITKLSKIVLTQALGDLGRLDQMGWPLEISFNFSPQSFNMECVTCLQDVIEGSGIVPSRITAEILESDDFLERKRAVDIFNQLQVIGIRIALDDVGSAYSSLLRLKELPIDKIKLDQGFICNLEKNPKDLHFVRALQDLATELNVDLVVEGVETADVLDAMLTIGVPYLQGYQIARPLSFSQLKEFLQNHHISPPILPRGLFGYYAGTLASHAALKKMIQINPKELNLEALPDGKQCRGHDVMHRLGYTEGSRLVELHNRYHEKLGKVAGHGSADISEWNSMEAVFSEFMAEILSEWEKAPLSCAL